MNHPSSRAAPDSRPSAGRQIQSGTARWAGASRTGQMLGARPNGQSPARRTGLIKTIRRWSDSHSWTAESRPRKQDSIPVDNRSDAACFAIFRGRFQPHRRRVQIDGVTFCRIRRGRNAGWQSDSFLRGHRPSESCRSACRLDGKILTGVAGTRMKTRAPATPLG